MMSQNYDLIAIFLIYGQFGAIRKPDSERIVYKLIFPLTVTFYLTKTENRTKMSLTQFSNYWFEQKFYFGQKNAVFLQKKLTSAELRTPWY